MTRDAKVYGDLLKAIDEVRRLYKRRRFVEVIVHARKALERSPGVVPLLILKALAAQQLGDDDAKLLYINEDTEALRLATQIDPGSVQALLEYGYHLYAVEANALRALEHFIKCRDAARESLRESYLGQIECLAELERPAEMRRVWSDAKRMFPGDSALRAAWNEALSSSRPKRRRRTSARNGSRARGKR
jgi:tetratricopeptide (TPR) repeat protein